MKKIVSCLLAAVLVISGWCTALPAGAVNRGSMAAAGEMEHTLSVEGSNSFGNLLEQTLDDKLEEQEENNGCNIFSAEVIDTTVVVDFETVENCTLVVGIYDESGEQMLASGSAEAIKGERTAYVEIETDQMPEYFYLRAFLADTEDFRPLCTVYESPNYTQEMQEFLSKTTDDFQADRVLNLDDDKTNNFAVYDEDTKLITQHEDVNQIAAADEVNQVYVIENADSSVTSLQTGDIFAYEHSDNEVLIIKVSSIEMNGTTATIIGEETSLEDVFAYIKIDATADTADAQVDASSCEEGVIYEGLVDYEDEDAPQTYAVDIEEKGSVAISVNLAEKKIGSGDNYAKISGGLKLTFEPSLKLYLSFTYQYLELKISYSANINASISGQVKGKISMPAIGFSPIPGVLIEFTPSFIARANASVSLSGTLGGTIGFAVSSEEGTKNLTAAPQFKTKLKGEVTVFIGFSLEPKVVIISDKIAEAGLSVEAGAEIKAVMAPNKTASSPSVHSCKACIDGDISAKYSASFKAKLLGWDRLTFIYNMREKTIKLWDFYYSFDYNEFGFTTCPHWMHKMTVIVKDMDGNPISDAEVGNNYITDDKGTVSFYLPDGDYIISVSKEGYKSGSKKVTIKQEAKRSEIKLSKSGDVSGGDSDMEDAAQRLSLGGSHSAVVTKNGELYMWGSNSYGQLGNGTTTNCQIPVKVLDNVVSVSLGKYHSAAIKTDGKLYMWGWNQFGQLGSQKGLDSNMPVLVETLDNVVSVSLGMGHSAAITDDGSLYTWGYNALGQLGDGTSTTRSEPIKIKDNIKTVSLGDQHSGAVTKDGELYMWGYDGGGQLGTGKIIWRRTRPILIKSNISSVSLGFNHSAAITTDGELYMWGYNTHGQLGDRTTQRSTKPIRIMDNVASVSLGGEFSAAIKTDGKLYMWGDNSHGQLGNGTTIDSEMPIKVMDNIMAVSFGDNHSAAINKDGDLYTWGGKSESGTIPAIQSMLPWGEKLLTEDDNIVTLPLNASNETAEELTRKTAEFTGLLPNETYNFYVMKSRTGENSFGSDNLLYISQAVSDSKGELHLIYEPIANDINPDIFVVGMTRTDLSSAEITLSNLIYNGQEQFVDPRVSYNGIVLTEGEDYEVCGDYSVTEIGEYTVIINGIGSYTGTRKITFRVDYPTPTVTLSVSTTTPAEGESVTLTAQIDGNGSYRYKFTLVDLATNRTSVLRNFGTSNKLIWKAAGAGTEKKICVEVKDDDGNIYKDSVQITVGM